jgi:hypothetical protein
MKTTLAVIGLSVALIGGTTAASARTTLTPTTIVTTFIGSVFGQVRCLRISEHAAEMPR